MPRSLRFAAVPAFALPILLALTAICLTPALSKAQEDDPIECLSRDECRGLRQELKELNREIRPLRREFRQLRQQIRELPDGEERDALIEEARQTKRELKQSRRERRPFVERYRRGCGRECRDR